MSLCKPAGAHATDSEDEAAAAGGAKPEAGKAERRNKLLAALEDDKELDPDLLALRNKLKAEADAERKAKLEAKPVHIRVRNLEKQMRTAQKELSEAEAQAGQADIIAERARREAAEAAVVVAEKQAALERLAKTQRELLAQQAERAGAELASSGTSSAEMFASIKIDEDHKEKWAEFLDMVAKCSEYKSKFHALWEQQRKEASKSPEAPPGQAAGDEMDTSSAANAYKRVTEAKDAEAAKARKVADGVAPKRS